MQDDPVRPDVHAVVPGMEVVAFDLDGTLTVRDCVLPFLAGMAGPVGALRGLARVPAVILGSRGDERRDAMKRHAVRSCLRGRSEDEVLSRGERFAERVARGWMRADTCARLRRHQLDGHVVVLVSASLGPYVHPLAEILEMDAAMCTEVEFSDGRTTGEIAGENCRGPEKVRKLLEWGSSAGFDGTDWLATAYGDSGGDTELLAAARTGVHVGRSEVRP
jgi:phosphatidylglycerophosphatase C